MAEYRKFIDSQTAVSGVASGTYSKKDLIQQFEAARELADYELFRLRGEVGELERWSESHRPFHWFIEFPSVWQREDFNKGFDVIVGNPPYIKATTNTCKKFEYTWHGYETGKCPDIYAVCMERAVDLLNDRGRFAMIVMHSICFNRQFEPLRNLLFTSFPFLCISSYARRPDSIFSGSAAVRNSIVIASRRSETRFVTSRCRRWSKQGRHILFSSIQYTEPDSVLLACGNVRQWPFVDDLDVIDAFAKLVKEQDTLGSVVRKRGSFRLGFKKVALYMLWTFIDPPPVVSRDGVITVSDRDLWMHFNDIRHRDIAFLLMAGRWMYLWWLIYGDEFDVIRHTIASFPAGIERLTNHSSYSAELYNPARQLLILADNLKEELPRHLKWQTYSGQEIGRYDLRECTHITDESDWLLAQAWGLSREQYDAADSLRQRMTFGQKD